MTAIDPIRSSTGAGSPVSAPGTHHHNRYRTLLVLLGTICAVLCLAPAAQAAGPELSVSLTHYPTTFQRGDLDADVFVKVTNSGDAPTGGPVSATLVLPAGLQLALPHGERMPVGAVGECRRPFHLHDTGPACPGSLRDHDGGEPDRGC